MLERMRVELAAASTTLIGLLVLGTVVYHFAEGWTWIDSFYFTVVLMTTVGMGDFHPTTEGTRLFTAIFLLLGVGAVVASLGVIGSRYLEQRSFVIEKRRSHRDDHGEEP